MSDLRPERLHLQDMNAQHISICGRPFIADVSGALYWPAERALIVADLKLGRYANSEPHARNDSPIDAAGTLITLAETVDRHKARTIIALGNGLGPAQRASNAPESEADGQTIGAPSIDDDVLKTLSTLQDACEWIWVNEEPDRSGSMDDSNPSSGQISPQWRDLAGGTHLSDITAGAITVRHKPLRHRVTHEIAGYLRPAARLSIYGHVMRRPCFVSDGKRLVLPAFASHRGGANVLDGAFDDLFGCDGLAVWMMGQDGVYPISTRRLIKD